MLRHELRELATENAFVQVTGRLLEIKRNGEHTDLLLKRCKVCRVERGLPVSTHPEISTDHLWLRVPTAVLAPQQAPADCPPELRAVFSHKGPELLQVYSLLGRAGFYSTSTHELGIGITETVPAIPDWKLLGMVWSAWDCFRAHPWRANCLQTMEVVCGRVIDALETKWVVSEQPATEHLRKVRRLLERCQRDHRAEVRARYGAKRQAVPAASAVLLNPVADFELRVRGLDGGSRVHGLLATNALLRQIDRKPGQL